MPHEPLNGDNCNWNANNINLREIVREGSAGKRERFLWIEILIECNRYLIDDDESPTTKLGPRSMEMLTSHYANWTWFWRMSTSQIRKPISVCDTWDIYIAREVKTAMLGSLFASEALNKKALNIAIAYNIIIYSQENLKYFSKKEM